MVILEEKKIYKYPTYNEALSLLSSFTNEIFPSTLAELQHNHYTVKRDKACSEFFLLPV